ncbi:MAG: tRNA dihydrouridine synthase DusB [Clostridiales bacterium]|nr:tRNA dihydrouridine synthase DusB [Clostridiales bacterium]
MLETKELSTPTLALAPMAGITDWIFRLLCFEQGCNIAFTEMISGLGYLCAPESNRGNREILTVHPQEGDVKLQVFGKEPEYIAQGAKQILDKQSFSGVDINMGCPARKIASKGEGVGLMKTPDLAEKIVKATCKSVSVPVSVKIRLGWDNDTINALSFAKRMADSGAASITVHGRTKEQGYSGKADWETIGLIKSAVSIPVFLNGDIVNGSTAVKALQVSKCDGLMIGRGAFGNPWIFQEIDCAFSHTEYETPTVSKKIETALRHAKLMIEWKGEKHGIIEMRKHIGWYLSGVRNSSLIRQKVNSTQEFCQLEDILLQYEQFSCQ